MKLRQKISFILLGILLLIITASFFIIKNAGILVRYKLEKTLGNGFSVERIDISWRELKAKNAVLKKHDNTIYFRTGEALLSLNIAGIIKREFKFSQVVLTETYLLIEIDREGRYLSPLNTGKNEKEESTLATEIGIGRFIMNKGSIDYSDGKVSSPPHLTRLRDIEFEIDDLNIPFSDRMSPFSIEASVPGNYGSGSVGSNGKINLKTRDMDGKVNISNLDITAFRPYFEKRGDARITRGFLDIDMDITIKNGQIRAPGRAVLRGLEFVSTTTKDRFLGVPRTAVISLLKDSNGAITIDFLIEGDINNPKFNLRESLLEKMTMSLADKLGLSVARIGGSVIVEGARQVEKGVGGIRREIEKLFKK